MNHSLVFSCSNRGMLIDTLWNIMRHVYTASLPVKGSLLCHVRTHVTVLYKRQGTYLIIRWGSRLGESIRKWFNSDSPIHEPGIIWLTFHQAPFLSIHITVSEAYITPRTWNWQIKWIQKLQGRETWLQIKRQGDIFSHKHILYDSKPLLWYLRYEQLSESLIGMAECLWVPFSWCLLLACKLKKHVSMV